jgi:hypothetical protein
LIIKSNDGPVLGVSGLNDKPFVRMDPSPYNYDKVSQGWVGKWSMLSKGCENDEQEYTGNICISLLITANHD